MKLDKRLENKSRKLASALRHNPFRIFKRGLSTDGFINIDIVLKTLDVTKEELVLIVDNNNKKRFEIKGDRIRARQGHSIDVDLKLDPVKPPDILYHGTVASVEGLILNTGISKMKRHHVHLSIDIHTATNIGSRRSTINDPVVLLSINAKKMYEDGHLFYKTDNDVWLTDFVPPEYISVTEVSIYGG